MPSSLYVVIESMGKWWVDLEGKAHGPYATKATAIEEGRSLARFAAHAGKHSELLATNEAGRYIVLWDSEKSYSAASEQRRANVA
jgi:hypothetical protein